MPKKKLKLKEHGRFMAGYEPFHDVFKRSRSRVIECQSCKYFYQAPEDDKELCQNPNVLRYDMTVAENRIFCNFWKGVWEE